MLHYRKIIFNDCFGRDVHVTITEVHNKRVIRVLNGDGCLTHARRQELLALLVEKGFATKPSDWLNVAYPRQPDYPAKFWGLLFNYDINVNYLDAGPWRNKPTQYYMDDDPPSLRPKYFGSVEIGRNTPRRRPK